MGSEHRNTAKKINEHRITARKVLKQNTVTATRIFSIMICSSTLKITLLYLNNFPQNKHMATLFIVHVSILLMPVNQFSYSCEETLREARKRTKKKRGASRAGLYPSSLSSFTLLTFLGA